MQATSPVSTASAACPWIPESPAIRHGVGARDAAPHCNRLSLLNLHALAVIAAAVLLFVGCDDITPADPSKPSFGSDLVSNQTYVAGIPIPILTLPKATGGDGTLTYRLAPEVPGLTFSADSRTLSGIPSAADSYTMQYEVRDSDGDTATLSFRIVAEPLTTLYWGG